MDCKLKLSTMDISNRVGQETQNNKITKIR